MSNEKTIAALERAARWNSLAGKVIDESPSGQPGDSARYHEDAALLADCANTIAAQAQEIERLEKALQQIANHHGGWEIARRALERT